MNCRKWAIVSARTSGRMERIAICMEGHQSGRFRRSPDRCGACPTSRWEENDVGHAPEVRERWELPTDRARNYPDRGAPKPPAPGGGVLRLDLQPALEGCDLQDSLHGWAGSPDHQPEAVSPQITVDADQQTQPRRIDELDAGQVQRQAVTRVDERIHPLRQGTDALHVDLAGE